METYNKKKLKKSQKKVLKKKGTYAINYTGLSVAARIEFP